MELEESIKESPLAAIHEWVDWTWLLCVIFIFFLWARRLSRDGLTAFEGGANGKGYSRFPGFWGKGHEHFIFFPQL